MSLQFCVVIHDCSLRYRNEVVQLCHSVSSKIGHSFALAVIPCHGAALDCSNADIDALSRFLQQCGPCGEYLIHGLNHQNSLRPTMISRLTDRSDEFSRLTQLSARKRIRRALSLVQLASQNAVIGLVPPAWQFPFAVGDFPELGYVMRFHSIECATSLMFRPLVTWSYDWGWLKAATVFAEGYSNGRGQLHRRAPRCIVLHPADIRGRWAQVGLQKIDRLLKQGYSPVLPRQLAECSRMQP